MNSRDSFFTLLSAMFMLPALPSYLGSSCIKIFYELSSGNYDVRGYSCKMFVFTIISIAHEGTMCLLGKWF